MEYLKNLFKDKEKKTLQNIVLLFVVGALLLILSSTLFKGGIPKPKETVMTPEKDQTEIKTETNSREENLEKRMAEILSAVEGAGSVKVMISIKVSNEKVIASNTNTDKSSTVESDGDAVSRQVNIEKTQGNYVILEYSDGSKYPLVLKEIEPQIEGVLVIAEGGDDIHVKDALTRAAYTVLGVEPHKVQILKMHTK